ncbi:hypothetical protein [Streptomyces sp. NPDC059743]|uniref:hypothetical protein n=1 Tax=Streptomyces sp. NPDC059743 TaxID=3346928 RepID=UPI0036578CF2
MNIDEIAGHYQTLVLEGCDGVGKSTLAQRLSTNHGFTVVHSPRTPDHLDLAESVITRTGALIHLTAPPATIHQRLLARDGHATALDEITALTAGYEQVFSTLADYTPVLTLDTTATSLPSQE